MLWCVSVAPLGSAGGAAGELDVDGVVELQLAAELGQPRALSRRRARAGDLVEAQQAGLRARRRSGSRSRRAGSRAAAQRARASQAAISGARVAQHPDIVAGLEALGA